MEELYMKIILDPSRDGCTIWFVERNSVKYIQGDVMDICKRIHKFSTHTEEGRFGIKKVVQHTDIVLDANGIGAFYKDCLEVEHRLKVTPIKIERELKI